MVDKFAIITGASTGIGFELAEIAAENGYDLLVVADEPLIDAAARDFQQHGVTVDSIEADLATLEGVDRLLDAAQGRRIDLLCANAGRGVGRDFLSQAVTDWRRVVDTNITGTVYLLQRVLQQMVAQGEGKVLITGSIAGFIPGSFQAVYNGSKAFIDSFADALRNELKDDGYQSRPAGKGRGGPGRARRLGRPDEGRRAHRVRLEEQASGRRSACNARRRDGRTAPPHGRARDRRKSQVINEGGCREEICFRSDRDCSSCSGSAIACGRGFARRLCRQGWR